MQFSGGTPGMLRQLADGGEIIRQQGADAMDQVVGHARPLLADGLGADVVGHAGGARREDGQVAAAFLLELELRLDRLQQHLVGDAQIGGGRAAHRIGQARQLLVAELVQDLGLGGVMAVDVDDHLMILVALARSASAAGRGFKAAGRARRRHKDVA